MAKEQRQPPPARQSGHDRSMRRFNTEGPVVPRKHYCIPPLDRMELDRILKLIREKRYFSLHAPRQTGKTSALLALQDLLNGGSAGSYRCVYVNVEPGQAFREDIREALRAVVGALASRALDVFGDRFVEDVGFDVYERFGPGSGLMEVLRRWAQADPRPLVLLIDEIDALVGDSLIAVLRQLRAGYAHRPESFPQSVLLCGVRDMRDYQIHSGSTGQAVTGGSAFNVSAGSLRLGDFSRNEMEALVGQHTEETGQEFPPEALQRLWDQTCGQPWLVNALCDRICGGIRQDRKQPITADDVLEAQEQLILERVVHLDQLADKLREERVRRIIEPILSGGSHAALQANELLRLRDLEYVRDLGLVARDDPPRIANPIYREIVPRELTAATQGDLPLQPARYVDPQRGLDLRKLLADFQDFFRQHSEHWLRRLDYPEAGPQLLLQAFLQRVVNGGGRVEREYALGRGRTDLLVTWPGAERPQRFVIECKILRGSLGTEIGKAVEQTAEYMDRCRADEGHVVIFDREKKLWKDKVFRRSEMANGRPIEVWGM